MAWKRDESSRNPVLRFLGMIWKAFRTYLIIVGLLVTLIPILLVVVVMRGVSHDSTVSKPAADGQPMVLVWRVDGEVTTREPSSWDSMRRELWGEEDTIYVPEIRQALQEAAKSSHVRGLFLDLQRVDGSFADVAELRRELAAFRKSGKPIRAHMTTGSDLLYYLASAAERVTLTPVGSLTLPGPTFSLIYFGDALKRLGVEVEPLRLGKYKAAIEPFILNKPTPEALENYTSIEKSLRDHLVESVAIGRGFDATEVRAWFRESIFSAARAKELRVVDDIVHPGEAKRLFAKELKIKDLIPFEDWIDENVSFGERLFSAKAGIALIEADGEIRMHSADGSSGVTPNAIIDEIKWARENPDVKAIVMRVSSPGGSANASELIWRELRDLAVAKPLVVSMGSVAASGGYYISVAGGKILAEPTTITGSIGVFALTGNLARFPERWGVSFHAVSESDRVAMFNPGERYTAADRAAMTSALTEVYETFKSRVAEGRHMDPLRVEELAQGRIFTGQQALDAKLVDAIGGMREAFREAKHMAGLDPDKLVPVLRYSDDQEGLSVCIRSARDLGRCLRRGGISLFGGDIVSRALLNPLSVNDPASSVAWRVMDWTRAYEGETALALWPHHVSMRVARH